MAATSASRLDLPPAAPPFDVSVAYARGQLYSTKARHLTLPPSCLLPPPPLPAACGGPLAPVGCAYSGGTSPAFPALPLVASAAATGDALRHRGDRRVPQGGGGGQLLPSLRPHALEEGDAHARLAAASPPRGRGQAGLRPYQRQDFSHDLQHPQQLRETEVHGDSRPALRPGEQQSRVARRRLRQIGVRLPLPPDRLQDKVQQGVRVREHDDGHGGAAAARVPPRPQLGRHRLREGVRGRARRHPGCGRAVGALLRIQVPVRRQQGVPAGALRPAAGRAPEDGGARHRPRGGPPSLTKNRSARRRPYVSPSSSKF